MLLLCQWIELLSPDYSDSNVLSKHLSDGPF